MMGGGHPEEDGVWGLLACLLGWLLGGLADSSARRSTARLSLPVTPPTPADARRFPSSASVQHFRVCA